MARILIGLPIGLMGLCVVLVLGVLVGDFLPAITSENLGLAGPFLLRTIAYALITAMGQVLIGLLAALTVLWLAKRRLSQLVLIVVFLLPYAIPATVIGLVFRFGLGSESMWAQYASPFFGVAPTYWLYDHTFEAAILASIWQFFPFAFLLSFLALRSIPTQTLRAAQIDGAPFHHILAAIVLPRIWPVLAAILSLRFIFMMVKFDTPYVFTETIQSAHDVATIELWRAIAGSTSPELSLIGWGLQLMVLFVAASYVWVRARRDASA